MRFIPYLLLLALLTSCTNKKDESASTDTSPAEPAIGAEAIPVFNMSPEEIVNPANPVVSVDGEILTVKDLNMETNIRLSNIRGASLNPDAMSQMKAIVIEQFITRSLLLNEAKKLTLACTEEDLKAELDKISAMIPEGLTIDEMLENSPLGKESMLDHIRNKIIIDKLSAELMKDGVKITDEEIDQFIAENKEEMSIPESVEARHILIQFAPDDDDAAKAEKKNQIESIRKEILDGADFAEVAKTKSHCPSSENGGFLGKFGRSDMVPEFGDAAFSQKPGKVGKVVTTKFGHHIILVEKHEKAGTYPREQVEARLKEQKMQSVMMEHINTLRSKADIKQFPM